MNQTKESLNFSKVCFSFRRDCTRAGAAQFIFLELCNAPIVKLEEMIHIRT